VPESKGRPQKKSTYVPEDRRVPTSDTPNPSWWVPVFVTLLLLGLIWIVVFYVSQGAWPVQAFNYWNLVAGFGLLLVGFAMTMRWK
jgi:hypothetical protein